MKPSTEKQRLEALESYQVIDADISEALEGLVELASSICEAPISLVNLLDDSRQVTKARRGLDITEIPREDSFCQHTIMGEGLMIVEDAREDPRFKENPLVTGDPNIRFYAGMPLASAGGHNLGAVCLIDREPRQLSEAQKRTLELIAEEVSARLELIKSSRTLQEQNRALKKSDLFIQNSSDVQAIVDPGEGTILEVNSEALQLYECPRAALIGSKYGRWIPDGAIRAEVQQFLGQTDRLSGTIVTPVTTNSDRELYLEHTFTLREGLWYVTARDITARKKTEKQLENSRKNLKRAQQIAQMGSWEIDVTTGEQIWSDQAYRILGYNAEAGDASMEKIMQAIHPDDIERVASDLERLKSGDSIITEHRIICQDSGSVKHVIERGEPQLDASGKVSKISGIVQDITTRKTAEMQLEKEKKLSDKIINSLPVDFYMFDERGNAIRWNENVKKHTGYSDQEIPDLEPIDYFPAEEHQKIREKIAQVFTRGQASVESRMVTKSGTQKPYIFNAARFEAGNSSYLIGTGQDISDQKRTQQELGKSLEEKSILLAEVHHRVKNNLAIISGLLELEAYKTDQAHTRRVLENSTMRIKSMAVVHEMLYQTDDFNTLNFKAFVPNVIEAIKGAYPPKEHPITFDLAIDDITLNINQAIPCGLIINELVTNAYQHGVAAAAGGRIAVTLGESSGAISLQVSDPGAGLPPGFTPEGGSLGFTLVETLAKQLKGEFSYARDPRTTFTLRFPKRNGKGAASALPAGYAP